MKLTVVDSYAQVLDLAALHFHIKISHDFSMLVCNGLEGWCWA